MHPYKATRLSITVLSTILGTASATQAQPGTRDLSASQFVTGTMESLYRQGDFDKAEAQLLGTLNACGEQCSVPVKARIWMYIGVVRADGRHKQGPAKQAFDAAVKLDSGVQLDQVIASPQAASLFVKAGGRIAEPTPPLPATPAVSPTPAEQPLPGQSTLPVAPSVTSAAPGTCFPACRSGFVCSAGQCVSACNPPCPTSETCTANGQCSEQMTRSEKVKVGWARGASVFGYVSSGLTLALTLGSIATNDPSSADTARGLGIFATALMIASGPIVAVGGASARNHPNVTGLPALRVVSWIGYGLAIADATAIIAVSYFDSIDDAQILSVGVLGALSTLGLAADAGVSDRQARTLQRPASSAFQFNFNPIPVPALALVAPGRRVPVLSWAGAF